MNRLWITGAMCSGKSSLAREISKRLEIPLLSLDDITYKANFREKYPELESRIKLVSFILENREWVIEGSQKRSWVESGLQFADKVFIVSLNKRVRMTRFLKKHIKEMLNGNSPKEGFAKKLGWVWNYEELDFQRYIELCKRYNKRPIVFKSQKQVNKFVEKIKA